MSKVPPNRLNEVFRKGGWIAKSDEAHHEFMNNLTLQVSPTGRHGRRPLIEPVQKFQDFIEQNSEAYMGFHKMFDGLPPNDKKVRSLPMMLFALTLLITRVAS